MRPDVLKAALAIAIALGAAMSVVGVSLLPLTSGPVVRLAADDDRLAQRTGLPRERALAVAETVRVEVVGSEPVGLPEDVDGRAGFGADAVAHLEDVRGVFAGARRATGASFAVLVVGLGVAVLLRRPDAVRAGFRAAGWSLAGLTAAAGTAAAVAPAWAFARFHDLFFAPGTWTFSAGELLVQLFPARFWVSCGVSWGVLVMAAAAALLVGWKAIPASVVEKDV